MSFAVKTKLLSLNYDSIIISTKTFIVQFFSSFNSDAQAISDTTFVDSFIFSASTNVDILKILSS